MQDSLTLVATAKFLNLDTREIVKLAQSGTLPGKKIGGHWEFNRRALVDYLQREMGGLSDKRLAALDRRLAESRHLEPDLVLTPLVPPSGIALPLNARTRVSVLSKLVKTAEQTELLWDPATILEATRQREEMCTTALPGGVAIPHPRQRIEYALAESFVVFGRTVTGIPFGALDRGLTNLFFLICCTDDATHLQVLARLCQILRDSRLLASLDEAEEPTEVIDLIHAAEKNYLQGT